MSYRVVKQLFDAHFHARFYAHPIFPPKMGLWLSVGRPSSQDLPRLSCNSFITIHHDPHSNASNHLTNNVQPTNPFHRPSSQDVPRLSCNSFITIHQTISQTTYQPTKQIRQLHHELTDISAF
jgi:hypothetical protein